MSIKIKIYSFNKKNLNLLAKKIENKLKLLNFNIIGPIYLPIKRHKFIVLRSPHVNKKSREQFGMYIHKRFFIIKNINNLQKNYLKFLILYLKTLCSEGQIKITYMPGKI